MTKLAFLALAFSSILFGTLAKAADATPALASFSGHDDTWFGFQRHHFTIDGCGCWVAVPKNPLPGNHWVWCMIFPDAYPDRTGALALLAKGYYYATMDVGNTFGAPSALAHLTAFYQAMTGTGLNPRVVLYGISRGGTFACNWAAQHPDKVSMIYGDAPVCNFQSWPYADGRGKDSDDFKALLQVYGFKSPEEAFACPTQPIHELAPMAEAHIPILCVVGDADTGVPYAENTAIVEKKYKELGGDITVIHKPNCGHHPHGLDDPTPTVNFVLLHDH